MKRAGLGYGVEDVKQVNGNRTSRRELDEELIRTPILTNLKRSIYTCTQNDQSQHPADLVPPSQFALLAGEPWAWWSDWWAH